MRNMRIKLSREYLEKENQRLAKIVMEKNDRIAELEKALIDYGTHEKNCIRSFCCAGEPTENGYRLKFADRWYQSRPVDETPKCECGLDDALKKAKEKL